MKKLALTITATLIFIYGNLFGQVNLDSALVAYYPFNGNAHDQSGNGYHGTVVGATLTEDQFGNPESAYEFDGIDDYIKFGTVLPDMESMTISIWVFSYDSRSTIVCEGDWEVGYDVILDLPSNNLVGIRADKCGYTLYTTVETDVGMYNSWRHIVWTMDNERSKVYVDNSLQGTVNEGGSNVGHHNFILGTEEYPRGSMGWRGYWKGKISDLRIYNRVLSEPEIQALFNEGDFRIYLSIDSLRAFPNDTIVVPINVVFPQNSTYSSAEINIKGFQSKLEFIEVVTDSTLIGNAGWSLVANNTDSLLITASAGADDIGGSGVLFSLKFAVPATADTGFIPVTLDSALFNNGETPVELISGGVNVQFHIAYGDVDLNGQIRAFDASLILKYLVDYITLTPQQLFNANVSLDTTVSGLDATLILQYVAALIDTLPYDTTMGLLLASGDIEMQDQQIEVGQPLRVPLILSNGENILSFEGKIVYNPEHLTYIDLAWSEQLDNFMIETNMESGEIRFAGAGTLPSFEEGVFATLQFTVNDFDEEKTTVVLQNLRWNEGSIIKDVATANFIVTGVEENRNKIPNEYVLEQNYPNPFNPTTTIRYGIPRNVNVKLTIYGITGRKIATLIDEQQKAGWYNVQWDGVNSEGQSVSSGVYLMRLEAGNFVDAKKILLIK